ncbi:hypothetical protein N0V85_006592 [Neurospora sp. IMI 360204]|nr:hypothetical protein N0V85_006592 [Neurospora sp. IMI 360204]
MDDVFSIGDGQDRESNTSVNDEEDAAAALANNVDVRTPDRNGPANENFENGQYFNYAAPAVWRHINRFTSSRLPVPADTCLRELLTLPLAYITRTSGYHFSNFPYDLEAKTIGGPDGARYKCYILDREMGKFAFIRDGP